MDFTIITQDEREELYSELWKKPVSEVAKKYGISDATLRKHCKRLQIPLPPRGYWQKIKNGDKANKTPLPTVTGDLKKYVRKYVIKYRRDIDLLTDEELLSCGELGLLRKETIDYIKRKCNEVRVSNQLRNAHHLISEHRQMHKYRNKKQKNVDDKAILPINELSP